MGAIASGGGVVVVNDDVVRGLPDVGSRYSALSLFGLVPAALSGIDLDELLEHAADMAAACHHCVPCERNPGLWLGTVMGEAVHGGLDKLTLVAPPEVAAFGPWVEQLVAESTGKESTGVVPVVDEDLAPPDHYGPDRLFVALRDPEQLAGGRRSAGGAPRP